MCYSTNPLNTRTLSLFDIISAYLDIWNEVEERLFVVITP